MNEDEKKEIRMAFDDVVNMSPGELSKWLTSDESRSVGQKRGDSESVGHASGRRIVSIKEKVVAKLTDADYEHMTKVAGYVARHSKQRPSGDVTETPWRYSLMNWGHDPLS